MLWYVCTTVRGQDYTTQNERFWYEHLNLLKNVSFFIHTKNVFKYETEWYAKLGKYGGLFDIIVEQHTFSIFLSYGMAQ